MVSYQDARNCCKCEKAFSVLTLHKHACAACGRGFCRNCSNHFYILTPADIEGYASWESIKTPTKPQRCCDFCFDRINNRKRGGEAVPVANTVHSKYSFGKKLGEGGFAEVFEATNKVDGNVVAVKCIKREAMDKEDIEAIFQEVRVLESLTHPNIVHLFEFFEEPTHYYMVMEIINGGELFDRIVAKTFYNEKEARDLALILLRALKYMHDRNIIHRDLKPENLLLTSPSDDADIKIVDFGFAIEVDGLNCTSQVGTPGYIAPEILNKIPYGRPADMWSLGVILYILLGGYPPFHDENQTRLFKKIKNADYVFHTEYWGEISEEAKDLIRRLLTVDMHQRLTVDDALSHPWITAADETLTAKNLDANLEALKKYQKTKKWRTGVKAIMAVNRMKSLMSSPTARSSSVDIPHTIEARYTLGKKLGEGGYAVVKEGVSKLDGGSYAIKVLNRKKMDKKHEDGLRHEVKIMMDLSHPHIVKAYDLFEETDNFYVVMEMITGGELFDRIVRKTCYKEAEARQLARTLLGAIKYMHDNNIVHRDLKPENLLLTSDKNDFDIKVVDFGFATEVDGENLRSHCGTPGYIAPEILKDLPYGKSVDMWSFGVILYILLGGYPPFYDKNQQMLFRKIMKGAYVFHPEYWQEVSDEGKDLIRKLLVVDVPSRLTVDQALAHPWFSREEEMLQKRVLTYGLSELRKFTARRKLRAGIRSVLALKRMQSLASASMQARTLAQAMEGINEVSMEDDGDLKASEVAAAEPVSK